MKPVPEQATIDGIEQAILSQWEASGVYHYAPSSSAPVFSIDTPPPTVSGSLHVGHVFSYTHTDLIARYKRMQGYNVFYPMGYDDNGLPTERRVQNYYGVRPDLEAPYIANFTPPFEGTDGKKLEAKDQMPISRQNFIELCEKLCQEDEKKFKELWQLMGISVDWRQTYQTIDERARRIAQKAFLKNLERGEAYQKEAPGLWDISFQTAVAQAELEAREYPGFYHRIAFHSGETDIDIETTRPELLAACVALIAHPDDKRYQHLFGQTVKSPLFSVEVPVLAHTSAEMDKGAGIAMCCTFGDQVDIQWWRELKLPLRSIIAKDGRLTTLTADWVVDPKGKELLAEINGKTTFTARKIITDKLRETGELKSEPTATTRMTNFYEKGDKPLEIVTSRQWYLQNGGTDAKLNEELLKRGKELQFYPDFMRVRYENWVKGLNNDWLISRQRFFGVPFPIWYKVLADGMPDYNSPITPDFEKLPIDPVTDVPDGYEADQRDIAGGFTAEKDVMYTWATSSLTPQIACGWEEKGSESNGKVGGDQFDRLFPMSLRPQGQDIIRTWLFSTITRAHLEHNSLPFANTAISGWILDPDHNKMSKSKGNVETPMPFIIGNPDGQSKEEKRGYGADAVRYWGAKAKLGMDAAFDVGQMKIGRRLAMKIVNVAKFVLSMGQNFAKSESFTPNQTADLAILSVLNNVIEDATKQFEKYDHAGALDTVESFFWAFCDDYVELVKARAYEGDLSALATLHIVLKKILQLLAPFTPYATEEAWSWFNEGSVHTSAWPKTADLPLEADNANLDLAHYNALWGAISEILRGLRGVKSEAKVSMKTPLKSVVISIPNELFSDIKSSLNDIQKVMNIEGEIALNIAEKMAISAKTLD